MHVSHMVSFHTRWADTAVVAKDSVWHDSQWLKRKCSIGLNGVAKLMNGSFRYDSSWFTGLGMTDCSNSTEFWAVSFLCLSSWSRWLVLWSSFDCWVDLDAWCSITRRRLLRAWATLAACEWTLCSDSVDEGSTGLKLMNCISRDSAEDMLICFLSIRMLYRSLWNSSL